MQSVGEKLYNTQPLIEDWFTVEAKTTYPWELNLIMRMLAKRKNKFSPPVGL